LESIRLSTRMEVNLNQKQVPEVYRNDVEEILKGE